MPYALVGARAPVLALVAKPIEDPANPRLAPIIDRLVATCQAKGGLGIAAPQVGISERLVVTWEHKVLINPSFEPLSDEQDVAPEACLSLPGRTYLVPRYLSGTVRCLSPTGDEVEWEADGFDARFLQHEIDHLNGVLISEAGTEVAQSLAIKL